MLIVICFLLLTLCILTHSQLSICYALNGLQLWFNNMIPVLLPFMILSGCLVRMGLSESYAALAYPVAGRVFGISRNGCYALAMGFLCGFPMGAKVIADLLREEKLSESEASYLLAFCNNIGPIYFFGVALPLLRLKHILPYLFGMYGIPLLYGFALRRIAYRRASWDDSSDPKPRRPRIPFLQALEESVTNSLIGIANLGGYMILFNLLNLPFHILLKETPVYIAPLLEITGGLKLLGDRLPLYSLILLPFGGFSCIAQTYSCIKGTSLSLRAYTFHKILLTAATSGYYLLLAIWRLS